MADQKNSTSAANLNSEEGAAVSFQSTFGTIDFSSLFHIPVILIIPILRRDQENVPLVYPECQRDFSKARPHAKLVSCLWLYPE